MTDQYKTISDKVGEGYYTDKRSKFLAFAHNVTSAVEAKEMVAKYRAKYYDSRHVCYAYMLNADRKEFYSNDDGEPSGTAGKPILGQINSHELTNVLIIVVRYYGGINLGTGGLIVAYRLAAADAIANCEIIVQQVEEEITFYFAYPQLNSVMKVVKDMSPRIVNQQFDNTCSITLSIRKSESELLKARLNALSFT